MKKYYAAAILFALILFPGCLNEDWSLCEEDENVTTLLFRCEDQAGVDRFDQKINRVNAVIFDDRNRYVAHHQLEKEDLDRFAGLRLTLDPGEYRVVCWANVGENSALSPLGSGSMLSDSYLETVSTICGCPLFYAPSKEAITRSLPSRNAGDDYTEYTLIVPQSKGVEKVMNFGRAHRTVNVYVRGLQDEVGGVNLEPTVEAKNLPRKYDFYLRVDAERRDFRQQAERVTTPEGELTRAQFLSPYFDIVGLANFNIHKTSDDTLMVPVNLKQYVEDNNLSDLDDIDILVDFSNGNANVTISMPNWSPSQVDPVL